jgi:hypothetical protein
VEKSGRANKCKGNEVRSGRDKVKGRREGRRETVIYKGILRRAKQGRNGRDGEEIALCMCMGTHVCVCCSGSSKASSWVRIVCDGPGVLIGIVVCGYVAVCVGESVR